MGVILKNVYEKRSDFVEFTTLLGKKRLQYHLTDKKRYTYPVVIGGYVMFVIGMALNYFLIFPFTLRFLGTYQVSGEVANMITLQSYMDTMLMMNIMLGILFELP